MNTRAVRALQLVCIVITTLAFAYGSLAMSPPASGPSASFHASPENPSQETRTPVPADTAATSRFDPAAHSGRVLYVDFWASWCAPCKASFPWMKALQERYRDQGLEVIAINLDRDREAADAFLAKAEPNFPIVFDPQGKLAEAYDLQGMPTTLLFDRTGTLRATRIGFKRNEEDQVRSQVEELLAEETPPEVEAKD